MTVISDAFGIKDKSSHGLIVKPHVSVSHSSPSSLFKTKMLSDVIISYKIQILPLPTGQNRIKLSYKEKKCHEQILYIHNES